MQNGENFDGKDVATVAAETTTTATTATTAMMTTTSNELIDDGFLLCFSYQHDDTKVCM